MDMQPNQTPDAAILAAFERHQEGHRLLGALPADLKPLPALDWGEDQSKGPLPVFPYIDRRLLAPHRNYIRATRCDRFVQYGESFYRLHRLSDDRMLTKASELPA